MTDTEKLYPSVLHHASPKNKGILPNHIIRPLQISYLLIFLGSLLLLKYMNRNGLSELFIFNNTH